MISSRFARSSRFSASFFLTPTQYRLLRPQGFPAPREVGSSRHQPSHHPAANKKTPAHKSGVFDLAQLYSKLP